MDHRARKDYKELLKKLKGNENSVYLVATCATFRRKKLKHTKNILRWVATTKQKDKSYWKKSKYTDINSAKPEVFFKSQNRKLEKRLRTSLLSIVKWVTIFKKLSKSEMVQAII